jgi:hypothetical protein
MWRPWTVSSKITKTFTHSSWHTFHKIYNLSWGCLGPSWNHLRAIFASLGAVLEGLGGVLGSLLACLQPLLTILNPYWSHLGSQRTVRQTITSNTLYSGPILGDFSAMLKPSLASLRPSRHCLGESSAVLGSHGAVLGLSWISLILILGANGR